MSAAFCVIGDPIIDVYKHCTRQGKRLVCHQTESRPGGALNVWRNLKSLLPGQPVLFADYVSERFSSPDFNPQQAQHITRWVVDGQTHLETTDTWEYQAREEYNWSPPHMVANYILGGFKPVYRKVLVVADYNKGTVSGDGFDILHPPIADLVVVDSKHRNLNLALIRKSKVKIWHCTGDEYNMEWARNFDWVVHSDGPNQVVVHPGTVLHYKQMHWIDVPPTTPVDTCGAGDTMTAALAGWLGWRGKDFDDTELADAARFAIKCCQEVIQHPGTFITTEKL